jgi:hypothetical protein
MSDPVLIPGGTNAVEIIQAIIMAGTTPTPVPGTNIFMGYRVAPAAATTLQYMVIEAPGGEPELTHGTIIALEHTMIDVIVYGLPRQIKPARDEALRLRYLIASKADQTILGLRMLYAQPRGNVEPLGADPLEHQQFLVRFEVVTEPSYVQ